MHKDIIYIHHWRCPHRRPIWFTQTDTNIPTYIYASHWQISISGALRHTYAQTLHTCKSLATPILRRLMWFTHTKTLAHTYTPLANAHLRCPKTHISTKVSHIYTPVVTPLLRRPIWFTHIYAHTYTPLVNPNLRHPLRHTYAQT